ncbi:MAG: methionyl-tRNA formyltransferase [Planctomycetota bacterium]|nr:methionyl-tRNA formyltransferase [Planctomycetota bacterium]
MRLVFLGSGAFGLPTLEALARDHDVAMVVTQPDRKAGRGGKLTPTPVGAWAAEHLSGVPLLKPERVNEPGVVAEVCSIDADAWVVIAFGQKLGKPLLEGRFAINLHASVLPRWRGAAPINAAILAGDTATGNSVITLADRMDAGLILGQSERAIGPTVTAGELHDLLAGDGPELVEHVLAEHTARTLDPFKQDEAAVTLAGKLSRADAWIDLADSAEVCRRRINGLSPWPGVQAVLDGQPLKLLRACELTPGDVGSASETETPDVRTGSAHDATPGTLLDPATGTFATGDGVLQLLEVQPAGKRAMSWDAYARGRKPAEGELLSSAEVSRPC